MHLKMVALTRKPSSAFVARKAIPAEIRKSYEKLYGCRRETKFYASSKTPPTKARRQFAEWLSGIEERIAELRRSAAGVGRHLTHREAFVLAGEWYAWFLAQYEDEPGLGADWEKLALNALLARAVPEDASANRPSTGSELRQWTPRLPAPLSRTTA
jgi:hypothetical protein